MHPHDRIHDAARARADELRTQAQRDFWSALGRLLRRAWRAPQRLLPPGPRRRRLSV